MVLTLVCFGQARHDANWVFGKGCGIGFSNPLNPLVYQTMADNLEPNASISDAAGNLQLYVAQDVQFGISASIFEADNQVISNGDNIYMDYSATNGAVFLPVSGRKDSIYLFHIGTYSQACGYDRCYKLYYTMIIKDSQQEWRVTAKNIALSNETVEESIILVKHINGEDWWLMIREQRLFQAGGFSNRYIKYLISKSHIDGPFLQTVQGYHSNSISYAGETALSPKGNLLAVAAMTDSIHLYDFNRCSGTLSLSASIAGGLAENYGLAFNGNKLYVSDVTSGNSSITRYDISASNISATKTVLWSQSIPQLFVGQLERINEIVYVSFAYEGTDTNLINTFGRHLSVIKRLANGQDTIIHKYLYLGDNSFPNIGLPNFPNYNLGPEGVFLASAGKDTTLCSNINSTGVIIGAPPVPNIIYTWQPSTGLSATNIAQPTANPTQSSWYYLTATDTTATSCAVNTDSVYVAVRTCTGITETQSLQAKLYPNPTNGQLTIELPIFSTGYTFKLFNLLGQQVFEANLTGIKTVVELDYASGIYLYQIAGDGKVMNMKLVVE